MSAKQWEHAQCLKCHPFHHLTHALGIRCQLSTASSTKCCCEPVTTVIKSCFISSMSWSHVLCVWYTRCCMILRPHNPPDYGEGCLAARDQVQQDAVGDARLRPRCRHLAVSAKGRRLTSDWCRHLANWTKHTRRLWLWLIRCIVRKHDVIHKTEVHNVSYCRQRRRIAPRPQVTRVTKN